MSLLITGSLAYDTIMDFPGRFKDHILPDQLHILSVAFTVETLNKNFGGCSGNIAYTIKLLGGDPVILAPLGSDGQEYLEYMQKHGLDTTHIPLSTKTRTAGAHITTDQDDNQITAFFPGALSEAENLSVDDVKKPLSLATISPTFVPAMIKHANECVAKNIPFLFDPGQVITVFSADELKDMISKAALMIGNDYEMKLIQDKTGMGPTDILKHVSVLITTLGERGSTIQTKDETINIAPCKPSKVLDPTGAGDAYRAGFLVGYEKKLPLKTCGQMGAVAAAYAIEHYGTQNHTFTVAEFEKRYSEMYGEVVRL